MFSISPYEIFARVVVVFAAMPIHEYAHRLGGSQTGRRHRLSMMGVWI